METTVVQNKFRKKLFVFFLILMCICALINTTYQIIEGAVHHYLGAKEFEDFSQITLQEEETTTKAPSNAPIITQKYEAKLSDEYIVNARVPDASISDAVIVDVSVSDVSISDISIEPSQDLDQNTRSFTLLAWLFSILPGFLHLAAGLAFPLYGALRVSKRYGRAMFAIFAGTVLISNILIALEEVVMKIVIEARFEGTTIGVIPVLYIAFFETPLLLACLYLVFKIITNRNQTNGAELEPLRLKKMIDLDEPMVRISLSVILFQTLAGLVSAAVNIFLVQLSLTGIERILSQDISWTELFNPVFANFWSLFRGDAIYQLVYGILCYVAVMLLLNRLLVREKQTAAMIEKTNSEEEETNAE